MAQLLGVYPLHRWTDNTRNPPMEHWVARVPIIITLAGAQPNQSTPVHEWVIDTGFAGEAFAWRHHLVTAGLDPDVEQGDPIFLRWSTTGERERVPVREADLWLVGNESGVEHYCLPLDGGIAFQDRTVQAPDPVFHRALIGMRVLRRVKFTVEIDFNSASVAISAP